MGRKLEYTELNDLFNSGSNFSITDAQYREKMGKELPKDKFYIKNKSPLANVAKNMCTE